MTFRNMQWCFVWLCTVVASAYLAARLGGMLQLAAVFMFGYALQAFVAEWLGVTVSLDCVSAPRRPAGLWPIAVFWRAQGSPTDIAGLTAVSAEGAGVVQLSWMRGGTIRLIFPTRDRKLEFFEAVRRFRPNVRVFREN